MVFMYCELVHKSIKCLHTSKLNVWKCDMKKLYKRLSSTELHLIILQIGNNNFAEKTF